MTYFPPPDDYRPPTRCERCAGVIIFGPVIGGHIWRHVVAPDHDVVMRPAGWWHTAQGVVRHGNGRDALAESGDQAGATPHV